MNNCNFTGHLTKDPELKTTQSGGKYCYFCLAVDGGKNKAGEKQTDFIDCIAYDKRAEFLSSYCIKGTLIEVNGRLHITLKEDSEGNKTKRCTIYADNIGILGGGKPKEQPAQAEAPDIKSEQVEDSLDLPFNI